MKLQIPILKGLDQRSPKLGRWISHELSDQSFWNAHKAEESARKTAFNMGFLKLCLEVRKIGLNAVKLMEAHPAWRDTVYVETAAGFIQLMYVFICRNAPEPHSTLSSIELKFWSPELGEILGYINASLTEM